MKQLTITHDGTIDIAVGRSRHETSWKNKELLWSELATKLSTTHRTAETHKEYVSAKKSRQDEIKDIGGFVGGYIVGGRKKAGNVLERGLITLDVDFANLDFWDDFTMLYECAAVLYSTHKHCPENPRLRLVLPLDRKVGVDEYEAIARRVAGNLNIEYFDPTTFQPSRMMYWPSTPKDGEYIFEFQDGAWLNADDVLNSYKDWRDFSQWPVSEKHHSVIKTGMKKQGDPLEKPGIVGAFCRTYTIEEAIELFLSDVYVKCDGSDDRYTFIEGSTSAGVVVYDNRFAYSHHGTDPASGKLCNAFDLVRLHKFGLKDEDVKSGTPGNRLPSYMAMLDFAGADKEVTKRIVSEKVSDAKSDFDAVDDEDSDEWKEKLYVDRKGNVHSTIDNILLIFENDPYFKGRIGFDDFEKCEVALKDLPWRKSKLEWRNRRLIDRDDSNIRHYLERVYGVSNKTKTEDAQTVLSERTLFHPVKTYLKGLTWDGESRLEDLFIDYVGAEDSRYTREVSKKSLVAAVARIFRPGIKYDTILTLVGEQGIKKSSLLARLGGNWFSDSFSFMQLKQSETKACEQIQGVWIVELAELSGLGKADIESMKQFVAKQDDIFRVAYGRRTEKFPRQCVFFATTNKWDFLRDPTGNRRYWPVACDRSRITKDVFAMEQYEIDQIWAEAVHLFRQGEKLYLEGEVLEAAVMAQRAHTDEHPWAEIIRDYLDTRLPDNWNTLNIYERRSYLSGDDGLTPRGNVLRTRVCLREIWDEAIKGRDAINAVSAGIIKDIMMNMDGWERVQRLAKYGAYGSQRNGYFRTEESVTESMLKQLIYDN